MPWQITFDGDVYKELDLTIDQACRIEKATGATWVSINPYRSAAHARAILTVMAADRLNVSEDEVGKKVGALTAHAFLNALELVDDDDLPAVYQDGVPLAEDGSETTGSSGVLDGSTGRPT